MVLILAYPKVLFFFICVSPFCLYRLKRSFILLLIIYHFGTDMSSILVHLAKGLFWYYCSDVPFSFRGNLSIVNRSGVLVHVR